MARLYVTRGKHRSKSLNGLINKFTPKCKACDGTGKNSKGGLCSPCNGTGKADSHYKEVG